MHHFDMALRASGPLKMPNPNLVKMEKILPKKIAKAGFKSAERRDENIAMAITKLCFLVVKKKRDRHEGLPMLSSTVGLRRKSAVDPWGLSVGAGIGM